MAELTTIVMWCMGLTLSKTILQEWQNGRSRSETKIGGYGMDGGL
jgi:hypothetical protein